MPAALFGRVKGQNLNFSFSLIVFWYVIKGKKIDYKTFILLFQIVTMSFALPGMYFFGFYDQVQIKSMWTIVVVELSIFFQLLAIFFLLWRIRDASIEPSAKRLRSPFLSGQGMFMAILMVFPFFTGLMLFWGLEPFYLKMALSDSFGGEYLARADRTKGQGAFFFSFIFDAIIPALCLNYLHLSRWLLPRLLVVVILMASSLTMGTKLPLIAILVWTLLLNVRRSTNALNWKSYLIAALFLFVIFVFYIVIKTGFSGAFPYASLADAFYSFVRRILAGSVIGGIVAVDLIGLDFLAGVENVKHTSWSLVYGKTGGTATMPMLLNMFFDYGVIFGVTLFVVLMFCAKALLIYVAQLSKSNPHLRDIFLFPVFSVFLVVGLSGPLEFLLRLMGILTWIILIHSIGKIVIGRKADVSGP